MGEASIIDDVVVHSVIESTVNSNWKTIEFKVSRNEEMNLLRKDYKTTEGSMESFKLNKQRILEEYDLLYGLSQKETTGGNESSKMTIPNQDALNQEPHHSDPRIKKILQSAEECVDIPKETRELVEKLLLTNLAAFYKEGDVLPMSIVEEPYIYLVDENRAVFQHAIPLSFSQKGILMTKVKTLVDMGVLIRHVDHTPFNSPVFLVAKQAANQYRMVNCFVKLNAATARLSQYPMMRADEATSLLSGMKCFYTLDFSYGFYQIGIYPPHQERTTFSADGNQWVYKRMASCRWPNSLTIVHHSSFVHFFGSVYTRSVDSHRSQAHSPPCSQILP